MTNLEMVNTKSKVQECNAQYKGDRKHKFHYLNFLPRYQEAHTSYQDMKSSYFLHTILIPVCLKGQASI
jgi:hypothetical protein